MNKNSTTLLILFLLSSLVGYSQLPCAQGVKGSMTPPPVNCSYHAGDSVKICFDAGGYGQAGSNWIHGFVFDIGSGWDIKSLNIVQLPYSCSGNGYWNYYTRDSSYSSDSVFGRGIYFDYATTFVPPDTNPGNNYGDENVGGFCTWSFCVTIKVGKNCSADLHFGVRVTPDGLTGAGTYPPGCTSNVVYSDSVCGYLITSTCDTLTSISTHEKLALNLFPNPVNSALTVGLGATGISNARVSVYSMDGRLINLPIAIKQSSGIINLNTSGLSEGMYILSVANKDLNLTSKFTVVRP